jgi:hypothetical protein
MAGMARRGADWLGMARKAGEAWRDFEGMGEEGRLGLARPGAEWIDTAGKDRPGRDWNGWVGLGGAGIARQDQEGEEGLGRRG